MGNPETPYSEPEKKLTITEKMQIHLARRQAEYDALKDGEKLELGIIDGFTCTIIKGVEGPEMDYRYER